VIQKAMLQAKDQGLIHYYMLSDEKGKLVMTNWPEMDAAIKKTLEMAASKLLEQENSMLKAGKSVIKDAIDAEMLDILETMNINMDFSRPTHLRYFAYQDQHMYFMGMLVRINGLPSALFAYLPDYFLERSFANREFSLNLMATEKNNRDSTRPELSFYSTFKSQQHIPAESDLWQLLESGLNRSHSLKVEDSGRVVIDGEEFLYLVKPLASMYKQSYIPCLITSTNPIRLRLREVSVIVAALAFLAIFGAVLLSLILAGSLLGPITLID
jgi:hypothetical protein